ncbi:hypothetical protein E0H77_12585 [Acinetobacter sp. ANC 4633]|uniref:hypothetical protein n=1 Tax=Acinetobacter sp. ANC 4633 TaxID=2529845 RepID=UPI00103B1FEF|nr:hypothetical protein [Acinetobacter sp. ANC 4633]TCB23947.1 hypothetical protein E0H77_12585 [Acinetobacter sp. ANC 4633]
MSEKYNYIYTKISTFGSLPTHKVFLSNISRKVKLVFADNTFIYGVVSDWGLTHSGLDSRKPTWVEEPKLFLEGEKIKLSTYRDSHPAFITEVSTG